jgi:site-specific recombinase XerD
VESRWLFLTSRAPLRALWPTAISQVVCYACLRAHVAPVRAHALRHALATEMLRQGGVVKLSVEIWDSRGEARKSGWIGPP